MIRETNVTAGFEERSDPVSAEGSVPGYISLLDVRKIYRMGDILVRALDGVNFTLKKGQFAVVVGPSGAGKTTVLNVLGGMDGCDSGRILIDGRDLAGRSSGELTEYRRRDVGFVFQFYNLMANLTALENVELAAQANGNSRDPEEILCLVGLAERRNNFPAQLSGGEQQRVAIARALVKNPKLLLCDEPTGALDSRTGKSILALLLETSRRDGMTTIVVTHNRALEPLADVVIAMRNGVVESRTFNPRPAAVEEIDW